MKILYVLEYYYPHIGGVETFFKKLVEGCVKKGHYVRVVTTQLENTSDREYINGVEIIRLKTPRCGRRYWFTFLAFFRLIRLIKKFDIIHTTTYNASLPAWLVGKLYGIKTVITIHEIWGKLWYSIPKLNKFNAFWHSFFEWLILKLPFDYYFTDSEYTKNILLKSNKFSNRLTRIYLGIDSNLFDPKNYNKNEIRNKLSLGQHFVYTYYGRPGWAKGLIYLVNAVPLISQKISNSKLLLILSKDPYSQYQDIIKTIKKLNISSNIILIESVPRQELPKYIKASNCIIIPSLSEGFGFSVAESCALGIPVAASYAGSIPEVISGKHIFFEPANHNSIAEAVIKIYKGEYLYKKKKTFNWIETINQYCQIYENL